MSYNTDLYRKLTQHGYILLPEYNFITSVDHPFPEDKMMDFEERVKEKYSIVAKLEIVCRDEEADKFLDIIRKHAHTGNHGDGRIFVSDILQAVNIRTGEEDEKAL